MSCRAKASAPESGWSGGLGLLDGVLEPGGAGGDGAQEGLLFGVGDPADALEVGLHDRVDALHGVPRGRQQFGQAGLFDAEQAHGTHGAADQAAQHVAAALVGGGDAVGDQHEGRADVVGDDPHADVVGVVRVLSGLRGGVLPAGERRGAVDHGTDLVGLVHVLDVLEDHREPLHAEARVDVLLGQFAGDVEVHLGADVVDLVLHEHEVPDLDVAVFIGDGAALDAVGRAAVVVDLRAGTGRAGLAGGPVVVGLAHPLDPLGRHAGVLQPQLLGLVVLFVDGDPEPLRRQSVAAVVHAGGEELPRELDGVFLEVVAKGEVAAHLEEGAVAGGLADFLDVTGPDALLHTGGPLVGGLFAGRQVRDERDHAGHGEQQGGVAGDQGGGGHGGVSLADKKVDPALGDLLRLHELISYPSIFTALCDPRLCCAGQAEVRH